MSNLEGAHFDCVIIGAGMSGLAAGIRLALADKNVIIFERHNAPGGLNSFYSFEGRKYDVGLHALTNFVPEGRKGTPLSKLFRQLRIPREAFDMHEQKGSRIAFPDISLKFTNDFEVLRSEIADHFPTQIDAFNTFVDHLKAFNEVALDNENKSAKVVISQYICDPLLQDMLLLPLLYYGSAQENDMDWSQFVIMFKSIYLEGFSRPFDGVRKIIKTLLDKYRSLGGKRKMKCGVQSMQVKAGQVTALKLDTGETITADKVFSSIGWVETQRLCSDAQQNTAASNIGRLSFVETISVFDRQPKDFGWNDTIIFFNDHTSIDYAQPNALVDPRSGVICLPNNYDYPEGQALEEGILRITALANYDKWTALDQETYTAQKEEWFNMLQEKAFSFLPATNQAAFQESIVATDMFTPRTVTKYTGHLGGAIYGAPKKSRDGRTHLNNLFLCGTDQGFLGIIGAMLSGISMANAYGVSH